MTWLFLTADKGSGGGCVCHTPQVPYFPLFSLIFPYFPLFSLFHPSQHSSSSRREEQGGC